MSVWPHKTLLQAPLQIIDGDRGKNYPSKKDLLDDGHCLFLNAGNVTSNGFVFSETMFIDKERDQLLRKGKLQRGDVLLTTRGTVGNAAHYGDDVDFEHVRINSGMVILRTNADQLNARFTYFFLRSGLFSNQVKALTTGSAQPQLPIRDMVRISMPTPPIYEQVKIVSVLSALDDKIENNRRMNETLEEMARAIFKSWFVDFDPVHAKAAGNSPAHMDADTAALFPSSFGDDGLPVGWCEEELKKICKFSGGSAFKHEKQGLLAGDYPFIKVSDMNLQNNARYILDANNWITEETRAEIKAKLQPLNSIVMAKIGVALTYNRLRFLTRDTIVDNNMLAVIPNEELISSTALFLILSKYDFNFYAKGSALPYLNASDLSVIPFVMPTEEVLSAFDLYTKPLLEKVFLNSSENQTLAELRDTLLPKLMSGEIRVADAEREVEATV
jgi:type I restriction enzyme, S subunit